MIPIFVVADGRSGTTLLMRLLSSHPEIVAYEDYPLEFRPALFSLYPDYPVMRGLGDGEWKFEGSGDLLYEPIKSCGTLPLENVVKIYAAIASAASKRPRYFAEKCPVGLNFALIQERLPTFRCVLLVRDPRDIILSARAFNRRRGFYSFREEEGSSVEDHIISFKRGYKHIITKMTSIKDAYLLRYEDLVLDGENTLRGLFEALGVSASVDTVRACLSRAASLEGGEHRTSASSEASVGRWRNEMPADWHALFKKHFGSILPHFGYAAADSATTTQLTQRG